MPPERISSQEPTSRDAHRRAPAPQSQHYPSDVGRWAIVVGISEYKHKPWNLDFAHRDAQELYDLLQTRTGGGFVPEHMELLVNKEATTARIRRALRSFLKKPSREDLVLIFLACHGTPDPDRPGNVYLLTHDTDPEDIAGTALPMWEVTDALQRTLYSERVILLADTCHSAAIASRGGRSVADRATEVNLYLKGLSETRPGVALLTSAEANEVSREGAQWGGGHGVFSYYLLKGMQGEADGYGQPRDGRVNAGELFDYVRDKVRDTTDHEQHPYLGPDFDRDLPIAITGGIAAREHYLLGLQLLKLGAMLDDEGRFRSAVHQLDQATRLALDPLPEAHLARGRALLALGEHEAAARDLQRAAEIDPDLADAHLYLGLARAKQGKTQSAAEALEAYLQLQPKGQRLPWIEWMAEYLGQPQPEPAQKYALLIGIDKYQGQPRLAGPSNDISLMHSLLVDQFKFKPDQIRTLRDERATRDSILEGLDALRRQAKPDDLVLIHYSGHAMHGDAPSYLAPYDAVRDPEGLKNTIDAEELDARVQAIPALSKILILDTHATERIVALAEKQNDYTLFLATSPELITMEFPIKIDGQSVTVGAFTFSLASELRQATVDATASQIMDGVQARVQSMATTQKPLLFGPAHRAPFLGRSSEVCLPYYDLAGRENYDSMPLEEVSRRYSLALERVTFPFPQLHYSLGRAFLDKGAYRSALEALETACEQGQHYGGPEYSKAVLSLGLAQLRTQRYSQALESFRRYLAIAPEHTDLLREPLALVEQLQHGTKHALLVGIDDYGSFQGLGEGSESRPGPSVRGAANDVRALERVLIHKYGFQPDDDIKVLINGEASREAVLEAFKTLVLQSREAPALFYFAGAGSFLASGSRPDGHEAPGILTAGSDLPGSFISLEEFVGSVGPTPNNLVTAFDTGWGASVEMPYGEAWGSRFFSLPTDLSRGVRPLSVPTAPVPGWAPDEGWHRRRQEVQRGLRRLAVGQVSICQVSIQTCLSSWHDPKGTGMAEAEFEPPEQEQSSTNTSTPPGKRVVHGVLSHALIRTLYEAEPDSLTYQGLADGIAQKLKWLQPYVLGTDLEAAVFSNPIKEERVHRLVDAAILQQPIRQTVDLLEEMIQHSDGQDPEPYLDLGVAHAALGDYERSVDALETAIRGHGEGEYPEARYHLGRVLLECGDPDGAVSELRKATSEKTSSPIAAYYYLGQAIRTRVAREAEALGEAAEAWQTYLQKGAPLGRRDEVAQFLRQRREGSLGLPGDDYDTEEGLGTG